MNVQFPLANLVRNLILILLLCSMDVRPVRAQAKGSPSQVASSDCRVEATDYKGWQAQRLSNQWV
jgi:hypothetical protein